jgi:hypothetical protein
MAERLNAAVLKTAERDERSVGSNPTLSSNRVTSYTSREMIMKAIRLSCSAAIVVLIVAGCSNGAPSAPKVPIANLGSGGAVAASFGEVLSSKHVSVKKQSCISGTGTATFSAKGTAKGPSPGTFSAKGEWNFFAAGGQTTWTFSETFKIEGKQPADGTITGVGSGNTATCTTFGPVTKSSVLQYHLGTASRSATTTRLKNASSMLEKLL